MKKNVSRRLEKIKKGVIPFFEQPPDTAAADVVPEQEENHSVWYEAILLTSNRSDKTEDSISFPSYNAYYSNFL